MNIEEIAIKIEILNRQNLSKSAEITSYTQSALTAKVKKMESEIGKLVFKRTPQGLKITSVGTQYLKYLQLITQEYLEFLQSIDAYQVNSIVNFGTSHTTLKIYGAPIANSLNARDTQLDVDFAVDSSNAINQKVHNSELDCALISEPIKKYPDLVYDIVATETFEIISSNDHIINFDQKTPITLLVLSKGCMYTRAVVDWLMNNQIQYKLKEIKSISSIQDFLQISNTIAVLNTKLIDLYNYTNIHYYNLTFNNVINTVFIYKKNESKQNNILQLKNVLETIC
ncbi:LysR substrate-binding domain-containing protein [Bacillus wiedmannii]|uniref:LysR family transcriptional regulator n=2 Tax=Bacillus wiedmannii TaxID=1890302 RepID=UPI00065BFA16|nr:LysR family transcriptional regulator [Bacillus wiedmannii]KMP71705.1 LysR family transcriptional regulator [Bacillus cereus]MCQ6571274.1 LysR family transcriptional regulator [Bacillus wiedmannii]WMS84163.1 LysR family transcriptional regulator [Bacillus wiedmannii]HDR7353286.1 LysR family transcriptional regulator [Bacillus wiedmannii]HDR7670513.1 LysR family transcriptional regulator [Bacillus wiedmannii]